MSITELETLRSGNVSKDPTSKSYITTLLVFRLNTKSGLGETVWVWVKQLSPLG